MSGKYVPPGRRKPAEEQQSPPEQDEDLFSLREIEAHFNPLKEDGSGHNSRVQTRKTLHDSAATPGQLAYVFLHLGANPRWDKDQILFTKSNLELLPTALPGTKTDQSDQQRATDNAAEAEAVGSAEEANDDGTSAKVDTGSFAVFKQLCQKSGRSFRFDGWYRVEHTQILEPSTPDLATMLEQKWSFTDQRGNARQKQRDPVKWKESLGQRWAVVKLRKDELADKNRGTPKVEKLPDQNVSNGTKKSVNEMLAELRMEDSSTKESTEAVAG